MKEVPDLGPWFGSRPAEVMVPSTSWGLHCNIERLRRSLGTGGSGREREGTGLDKKIEATIPNNLCFLEPWNARPGNAT